MRSFAIVLLLGTFTMVSLFVFAPLFAFAAANKVPIANPGGPYEGTTDATKPILFDGSASSDADGDLLVQYTWNFGDGTPEKIGGFVFHTYEKLGVFTVTLTVNDGTVDSEPVTTTAIISLKPPKIPTPASGAPFITFPLQLDWEDVSEAKSYHYELIGYEENGAPKEFFATQSQSEPLSPAVLKFLEPQHPISWYQDECNKLDGNPETTCTDGEFRTFVKQQQKRLWHVKSCEDDEGIKCGPWSAVWDFAYVPGPPPIDSFSPAFNKTNVKLPVTLNWGEVTGAQSYLLNLPILPAALFLLTPEERKSAGLQSSRDTEYFDDVCLFTRGSGYEWGVASCIDADSVFCGPFQQSSFYTSLNQPPLAVPKLTEPLFDPAKPVPLVSMSSALSWSGSACAYLYNVRIVRESDGKKTEFLTNEVQGESVRLDGQGEKEIDALKRFWQDPKNLNQVFSWQVTSCWANPFGVGADCTYETPSELWKFRTSAVAPTLQKPAHEGQAKIPILLSWQGNGVSYRYQMAKDDGFAQIVKEDFTKGTSVEIAYSPPDIIPGGSYWWQVKTCVDEKGDVCGPWSEAFKFSTFALLIPDAPNPSDGGTIQLDRSVSWKSVDAANAYAYHLEYACRNEKENKEECAVYGTNVCPDTSAKKIIEDNKVATHNGFELPYCMGQYEWKVLSCLNDECLGPSETRTAWSNEGVAWEFTAVQPPSTGVGLVPCGKPSNDPATPYDETDSCQPKHIMFLLQNLLDFILWKLSLATLLVLSVITGATSYFSLGGPNALVRIKTVFKSFFVGFLILMFAWMFVNIILMLFGFQFEFFGRWWEISF